MYNLSCYSEWLISCQSILTFPCLQVTQLTSLCSMILSLASFQVLLFTMPINHPASVFKPCASALLNYVHFSGCQDVHDLLILRPFFPWPGMPIYTHLSGNMNLSLKTQQSLPGKVKNSLQSSFSSEIFYFLLYIPAVASSRNVCHSYYNLYLFPVCSLGINEATQHIEFLRFEERNKT